MPFGSVRCKQCLLLQPSSLEYHWFRGTSGRNKQGESKIHNPAAGSVPMEEAAGSGTAHWKLQRLMRSVPLYVWAVLNVCRELGLFHQNLPPRERVTVLRGLIRADAMAELLVLLSTAVSSPHLHYRLQWSVLVLMAVKANFTVSLVLAAQFRFEQAVIILWSTSSPATSQDKSAQDLRMCRTVPQGFGNGFSVPLFY